MHFMAMYALAKERTNSFRCYTGVRTGTLVRERDTGLLKVSEVRNELKDTLRMEKLQRDSRTKRIREQGRDFPLLWKMERMRSRL